MRTLLVDNRDSYTFNLFQLLGEVTGREPLVVDHREHDWPALAAMRPEAIVLSPGPGRPAVPRDVGVCLDVLRHANVPVLGVCLGHQALAHVEGGVVARAPEVAHGVLSPVRHDGSGLFAGLPQGFLATRYHSLTVATVPASLRATAWTPEGVLLGLAHRHRPRWGVQFHPESVGSEHGAALLTAFRDLARGPDAPARARARVRPREAPAPAAATAGWARRAGVGSGAPAGLLVRDLGRWVEPETAVCALYPGRRELAWLDSARTGPGVARWSFVAVPDGPLGRVLRHDAAAARTTVRRPEPWSPEVPEARGAAPSAEVRAEAGARPRTGHDARQADPLEPGTHPGPLLAHAARTLAAVRCASGPRGGGFAGGLVGYLGHGLQGECGLPEGPGHPRSRHPDAGLLLCDRVLAFDHLERRVELRALARPADEAVARAWLDATQGRLAELTGAAPPPVPAQPKRSFAPCEDHDAYVAAVRTLQAEIVAGETYEACLTTELCAPVADGPAADPLALHRALRRGNPAPHAALLRLGELALVSSSPERFLRVEPDGTVEARPIKGTAARAADPDEDAARAAALRADPKARAENLMIADLLRNDLGRVCAIGTVRTPELMVVESHATVHQLVTGVRGRLRPGLTATDAVRATFPGGSMTGAPKRRTLEILERLERRARGPYAGALGWFGADGAADLSIVIRTVVADGTGLTVGAGGAVLAASDPEAEHAEMLLKARAVVEAVGGVVTDRAAAPAG